MHSRSEKDNEKLRIGIIGGSVRNGWAKNTHIPAVQQLPELELSAVSTSHMESAEQSAREFNATHAFASATALSQYPEVDAVVVSVKVKDHYDAVKSAVSAGKPVYCEWPLGSNTAQAMEMKRWAESKHVPNTIGLQARQAPIIRYMKDLIDDGFIGKPLSSNLRVYTKGMGGTGLKGGAYLFDRKAGGNLLTIVGGHPLDGLTYMLGDFKEVSSTTARQYHEAKLTDAQEVIKKTTEDQILATGKLMNGAIVNVHIQGGIQHQEGFVLEVFGDRGTLVLTSDNPQARIQYGPYNLLGASQPDDALKKLIVPDQYYWIPETIKNEGGPVVNIAQAHRKFASDIREGTSYMPNFADAVKVHQLLDAIVKSAETGERQYL